MTSSADNRETALITGASSGIGLELARLFAEDRYDLVLVARNLDRLAEIGRELADRFRIRVTTLGRDLVDPAAPMAIFHELDAGGFRIDVLVNNAGYGLRGRFSETDLTSELQMIQVNMTAVTHLTKLALGPMMTRGRGKILNVASTAGFQPGPLMAVYYATKAYVLAFSEAIACELRGTGVTVTALCPGPTATAFETRARMTGTKLFVRGHVMDAASVARAGYDGLMRGSRLVIPGLRNKLMVQALRIAPRAAVLRIARSLQEA